MAERAHPDTAGFQAPLKLTFKKGFIPWLSRTPNEYRDAFYWRYKWVASFCRNLEVIDIPCGMGWGTSLIKGAKSVIGVDISPEAIAEANQRYGKNFRFVVGSMEHLEFPDNNFDVVSCLEGIEHVPTAIGEAFMREAARVLKPGGLLLLSSPHPITGTHSGNPYHVYEYPPEEMRALISRHFKIESETQRKVDTLIVTYFQARLLS
jgi:ubiquinone/menaquinone biosynthesis C-methylase UbiE